MKVRKGRVAKAMRRAGRAKAVAAKHRKRLLISAIIPVALYGAEHTPWTEGELQRLGNEAVRVVWLNVIGVPFDVLRCMLGAEASPEWRARCATVERWAREVWIMHRRVPGGASAGGPAPG